MKFKICSLFILSSLICIAITSDDFKYTRLKNIKFSDQLVTNTEEVVTSIDSIKLDWTEYYFPRWEYGVTYKGNAQEPVRYRVSYNGRIYTREFTSNEVQLEDPFISPNWTDVTVSFTNHHQLCRAEGYGTLAGGLYSHAEGYRTYAVTDKNIGSTAAHAEGSRSRAVGDASHAEGRYTLADMHASHAEGLESHASAQYSHAEGDHTTTYGKATHAEGYNTTAGLLSDKEGQTSDISSYAHAEGDSTFAIGFASHSEGGYRILGSVTNNTTAIGKYSHAEGGGTRAFGEGSHSEGGDSVASNKYAHAEGLSTLASGQYSHAEGSETVASASGSHAEGRKTTAGHTGSHVEGRFAKSAHQNVFVWSGVDLTSAQQSSDSNYYKSNAKGTFNINPVGGLSGFYIGKTNLQSHVDILVSRISELESQLLDATNRLTNIERQLQGLESALHTINTGTQ